MSNSTFTQQGSSQSHATVLGPGVAGLFLQGLETGLVIAEFSRWVSSTERSDSTAFSTLVIFVTVVGFTQSGIYFASSWRRYVQKFGQTIEGPDWMDYMQAIPNSVIAAPIQALMIWRCYHIVRKNMYIITPLVLLLITSIAMSIQMIVGMLRFELTVAAQSYLHLPETVGISYKYLTTLLAPSFLDIALTGILLHSLSSTMKHVYATHIRRKLSHFITVIWQSAIPPTLCTIFLCILYIQYATAQTKKLQFWYVVIQGMIGKLYVLSLFYLIIDSGPTASEQPPTFIPTLTIPIEGCEGLSFDSDISCHRCPSAPVSAMSVNTAV